MFGLQYVNTSLLSRVILLTCGVAAGCGDIESASVAPHQPNAHDEGLVTIGDFHHGQAVFEEGGEVRLYILGPDGRRVVDLPSQRLEGYVRPMDGRRSLPMTFDPSPQPGDTRGRTSLFVGTLPEQWREQTVEITVPTLQIGRERFRFAFDNGAPDASGMPAKIEDDAEVELYLTPGGKYSQEDVAANGSRTASQAFKGFRARHDFNPATGDRVCPITRTKANSKCAWIIDGREYWFCCPPCVDEFVQLAKDSPEAIKPPEAYVAE